MAEFSEIIHQYNRMCYLYIDAGCVDCPMRSLGSLGLKKLCENTAFFTPDTFVRVVEQWAADHPEPVYPTWGEWLLKQGVICAGTEPMDGYTYQMLTDMLLSKIPAEIAEKLGIKPKGET